MSRPNLPGIYVDNYPREYQAYNTQYAGQIESIGWKWWDTQTYVSGTTTALTNFFNVRATPDLSNMEVAFQLAAPKAFLIRAVRFFLKTRPLVVTPAGVSGAAVGVFDNIAQLINAGVMTLTIGNKSYDLEPLWCLTAGGGAAGAMAMAGGVAANAFNYIDYAQNGIADPRAVNTLSKPLFIGPQINFNARIDWDVAKTLQGGNVTVCLLLDGDLLRPVQ
jgi:hypothetical protein